MTIRKALLRAHRWCGIGLATLVVPAGATGSLQASHHEIDAALAPELHRVEPRMNRVSLDDIAARIEAGHRDLVVGYFLFTPDPGAAIRVIMNTRTVAHHGGQGFGLPGRILICGAGLLPLPLTGTGFWLWLRRRNPRRRAQVPVPAALPPGRAWS